jgi:TRAP-type C4-dicarboxylate transport system substrate-binding protein
MKLNRGKVVAFALLAGASMLGGAAQAAEYKITVATGQPLVFPYIQAIRDQLIPDIDKRLAATGQHKILWTQAYAGTLVKVGSEIESVSSGVTDMAFVLFPNNQSKLPMHAFTYFAPFSSLTAANAVTAYNETQKQLRVLNEVWDKNNQVYLATIAIESFSLFSKKPIRRADDFKGVKIGVIGPNVNWLRGTGAVGVTLNLGQITSDLATGIYDAALMGDSVGAAIKVNEAGPNRTAFNYGAFVFAGITINKDKWQSLPPDVRNAITAATQSYEKAVALDLQAQAKAGVEGMIKAGMNNIEVDDAGRLELANRMPDIAKDWASALQEKGIQAGQVIPTYLGNLRKLGEKPLRNWGSN